MTVAALSGISQPRFGVREVGLWTSAAAIILAAHVAVAYAVQDLSFAEIPDGGPPPALAVEMAPLVVAPAVPEEAAMLDRVTSGPPDAAEETEKPAVVRPVADPLPEPMIERTEPATEPPIDADKAQEADPAEQAMAALSEQPPLDEVVPDPVEAVAPDVVIPLPKPKAVDAEVKAQKPVEARKKTEKKPVDKPKERVGKEKASPSRTMTTASIDTKVAAKVAAPQSSNAAQRSSVSPSRWNSSLAAWITRHTRYPGAARFRRVQGTPIVTFTVDTSGKVVSARLARSSGDGDLDRAALAALQGASVPAPPAELGARVTRTAPFVFSLRD
ncbi:TonB family protein [Mesorhizobium sp. M2D.F.Ca.ET.185.01.1.1]|uniref:energy transducer TonB family protein n=1 Tax=unclassified Mesorhizobium TaxID=325217 RepID=UPI000FCA78C8|nr:MULTISPECIES: energy transducer TonB [unclassified Mesorhizobium]TGP75760.1 TonB family protein [bacterium M00.F.Ca.ET.227.01.1.1]TGP87241.1 TonB family protein [bacterium M00.F.Ca.ET.221.01.1.1]TGP91733.1 TonB family protein [bacterium M00.F.Ca.ET.222.01.1.1]TGU05382.1 TonB family protein [bacterium M00.F.Ca.ET.163.01.1.1]TGU18705.1 TonB family protein [bacterium M00.F.Ca.ET.156.01.1.1]TGU44494.1 TonB family protein [bacterium M00.F.Ca.ET.146.01.1.1]TGV67871.1 TonB family protein [Mesorh